ncbi:MAG: right-handed parallel beta-helix repeat-containing protein, partial [Clostridia bacterium]|nr:right-handed parallel beta-helix repeat-containing protein [Clostridia bacterium]
ERVNGNPYFKAPLPKDPDGKPLRVGDLCVDGERAKRAKSPVFTLPFGFENGSKDDPRNHIGIYMPERFLRPFRYLPKTNRRTYAEAVIYYEWEWYALPIAYVDGDDVRDYQGETYARVHFMDDYMEKLCRKNNGFLSLTGRQCYIRNQREFLHPGEYTADYGAGFLYYYPKDGTPETHTFGYTTLEQLLVFRHMENVTVKGLTFTGATSCYRIENGFFGGQANTEVRIEKTPERLLHHAALRFDYSRNTTLSECVFRGIGCIGAMYTGVTVNAIVTDCRFSDIGMTALSFGEHVHTWCPTNQNICVTVENNLFTEIGYDYPAAICMYIDLVDGLEICHNTIRRCAYSGISVGWNWSRSALALGESPNVRDAEIAYNRIEQFMTELRDGAAIYVLGGNVHPDLCKEYFNFMHDNYASYSGNPSQKNSEYPDASKRGYYMDGSSSNWKVSDSVICGVRLPLFSQFHCPDQFTFHNLMTGVYSTYPIDKGNHAPWRDTLLGENFDTFESEEELLANCPAAAEILENSGCTLEN